MGINKKLLRGGERPTKSWRKKKRRKRNEKGWVNQPRLGGRTQVTGKKREKPKVSTVSHSLFERKGSADGRRKLERKGLSQRKKVSEEGRVTKLLA